MMFLVLFMTTAFAITCNIGEGANADGSACAACVADETYSDVNDDTACKDVTDPTCTTADDQIKPGTASLNRTCGKCPVGTAATKYKAAADPDPAVPAGHCTACVAGTNFADVEGLAECKAVKEESVIAPTCTTADDQIVEGTASADRECGECPAGFAAAKYKAAVNADPAVPAGLCTACAKGTFAKDAGAVECAAMAKCEKNGVKTEGTTSSDAECCSDDDAKNDAVTCTKPDASSAVALAFSAVTLIAMLF